MVFNTFYNFSNSLMLPTPFFEPVVVGLLWTAWNFVLFLFSQHWLCERLHHLRFSFKNRDIWMRIGCNGSWLGEATRRIFWVSKLPLLLGIFFCLINGDTKTSKAKATGATRLLSSGGKLWRAREREKLQLLFLILEKFTLLWTSKVALLTVVVSLSDIRASWFSQSDWKFLEF